MFAFILWLAFIVIAFLDFSFLTPIFDFAKNCFALFLISFSSSFSWFLFCIFYRPGRPVERREIASNVPRVNDEFWQAQRSQNLCRRPSTAIAARSVYALLDAVRALLPIPHTAISHYVFLPDTTSAASSATSLHTTNSYKMILSIVLRLFKIISDRSSNRN